MTTTVVTPLVVRRSIFIKAPPERVWRAFETHERMTRWWGVLRDPPEIGKPNGMELVTYEARVGGMLEMRIKNADGVWRFGGKITVFDPARELTFENNWFEPGDFRYAAPTYITLRLTAATGGTMVELLHHGFERCGRDPGEEHRGYEGGWGMLQLETLRELVEGA
jgi:uncharacterized protein YndB with AHSA1/START domain